LVFSHINRFFWDRSKDWDFIIYQMY